MTRRSTPAASSTSCMSAQSGQASFDIAETGVITAAQAQAGAFKTNVPNGSSWYIVVNGITSNVITQGI